MPDNQLTRTPDLLNAALTGLEAQRQPIETQIAEVRRMLGGPVSVTTNHSSARAASEPATLVAQPRKRKLSAEGRKRLVEATKKRWAEQRKREGLEAQHQEEVKARRVAAMAKARKALAAKRKAAKKAV